VSPSRCRRLELSLPLPPSVNHSHRNIRLRSKRTGRLYTAQSPTKACRSWRSTAGLYINRARGDARWETIARPARVVVELRYFWPDLRRRDTHNRIKEVCDALQRCRVFEDDCQVVVHELGFELDRVNGHLEIAVFAEEAGP
jgi:crossover junction endodeoxyribonuclease RusA